MSYALHFRRVQAPQFQEDGISGSIYSDEHDFERASAARITVASQHGRTTAARTDRVYLVVAGSGWFAVGDERFAVDLSDVVIVPRGTEYDFGGTGLEVFVVHCPAFDPSENAIGTD
jgi:mannose-6-phosphate isomerase-like protein (cupin superfamily)